MQVCDFGKNVTSTPATGDDTVTIADLAMFLEFDSKDPHAGNPACAAYHAIDAAYSYERTGGAMDFYDGCWMSFADGSTIQIEIE